MKTLYSFLFILILCTHFVQKVHCQSTELVKTTGTISSSSSPSGLQFGINVGYDLLPKYSNAYTYYGVNGGLKIGATVDYYFGNIGVGLDYDYLKNGVSSTISNPLFYDVIQINSSDKIDVSESITRHFVGLGPNYILGIGNTLNLKLYARGGYSIIKGGELITTATHPDGSKVDHHMMFSGLDAASLAIKAGFGINYSLTNNLAINAGVYYLNQLAVHPDRSFELNNRGQMGLVYGHTPFVQNQSNYAIGLGAPYIIAAPKDMTDLSDPYISLGVNLGVVYRLNAQPKPEKKKEKEPETEVVSNNNKIIITVEDEVSKQVIPGAEVILKNQVGQIVSRKISNKRGVVEFDNLAKEDYAISGTIFGTPTSVTTVGKQELNPQLPTSKKIFYFDLRFILKGSVLNKKTKSGEPGVTVSLTNNSNRAVLKETTSGDGSFGFVLEKNASYSIVAIKENKLSDMRSVTTKGLNRSTTLFVDLELGVENFDCGRGTILDIKYEFDKSDLLSESRYEIDKVIRYMKDHPSSKIEMSAHTDSRGPSEYNLSLSDKRARSAVDYILSRGISAARITAQGYGETRLKNHCKDGTTCSEAEHSINRRTEATLLCR